MATAVQRSSAMTIVASLIACAAMIVAHEAKAQCPTITVRNQTGASVFLCLQGDAGLGTCDLVPPGKSTFLPCSPTGARDASGGFHPFMPGPSCFGCTPCITLSPPSGISCAMICYDPACCTVWIFPCSSPC